LYLIKKQAEMKNNKKWAIGLAVLGLAIILYKSNRKKQKEQTLLKVAEEGYETAQDVLFPSSKLRSRKQHYGPVLPR
jgi:hypothetical protein